jgi:hypothetical protein
MTPEIEKTLKKELRFKDSEGFFFCGNCVFLMIFDFFLMGSCNHVQLNNKFVVIRHG